MARWQISLAIAGMAVVIGAFIGVSMRGSPESSREPRSSDVRPIEKGDEYVAIGDSYTAAPASVPSNDPCWRTSANYPHQVAAKLGLKLTDVSCAGAATSHVIKSQVFGWTSVDPQADALSRDTDLVTVSLGGNDFRSLGAVAYGCSALRSRDPSGAPCQQGDAAAGERSVEQTIKITEQRLVDVLAVVAERAPDARIVVIGYPEFFPRSGPCAQLPLALGDYAFAHRVNALLVRAQKRAAARANAEYVDVFTPSRGHDMCAKDPWIAGLRSTSAAAMPLHPYPKEQQLVARLLLQRLS